MIHKDSFSKASVTPSLIEASYVVVEVKLAAWMHHIGSIFVPFITPGCSDIAVFSAVMVVHKNAFSKALVTPSLIEISHVVAEEDFALWMHHVSAIFVVSVTPC